MGEGKRDKREGSCNFLCGNSVSTIEQKTISYRILPQPSSEFLPPGEKVSLNIIEETTVIKDNRAETSLLWKVDAPHLTANRKISINSLESLKRKLQKNPDFAKLYHNVSICLQNFTRCHLMITYCQRQIMAFCSYC